MHLSFIFRVRKGVYFLSFIFQSCKHSFYSLLWSVMSSGHIRNKYTVLASRDMSNFAYHELFYLLRRIWYGQAITYRLCAWLLLWRQMCKWRNLQFRTNPFKKPFKFPSHLTIYIIVNLECRGCGCVAVSREELIPISLFKSISSLCNYLELALILRIGLTDMCYGYLLSRHANACFLSFSFLNLPTMAF